MLFKRIRTEIDSMMARDPAARSRIEVWLCYPGFHALLFHRLAHAAWRRGWRLGARFLSQFGRWISGIEIHPAARIGANLFVDHGMGVVIGETAEIGDNVTLYQGVTLGGIAPSIDSGAQVDKKRHPTIQDDVIIGSGAQVLGPITVGHCARVGANAVVVRDVPPNVTVTGIPARASMPRDKEKPARFMPYGTPGGDVSDPIAREVETLRNQVAALLDRIEALEAERADALVQDTLPPASTAS